MPEREDSVNNGNAADSAIRDHLVNTAVNFLLNPDVRKRHDDSKINFLKKKGLTDVEISAAFERVKLNENYVDNSLVSSDQKNKFYHPQPYYHQTPYSFWSRLSGLSSSLIVFGVTIYGLHHFYKKFIRPWMFGENSEEELNHTKQLAKDLAKLTEAVEKLHTTIMKQNEEIAKLISLESCGYAPTPVILDDLKREISSLKAILISRHQFPAVPQIQTVKASIPSWQLPDPESDALPSLKLVDNDTDSAFTSATSLSEEVPKGPDDLSGNMSVSPISGVKPKHPVANGVNGLVEDTKEN